MQRRSAFLGFVIALAILAALPTIGRCDIDVLGILQPLSNVTIIDSITFSYSAGSPQTFPGDSWGGAVGTDDSAHFYPAGWPTGGVTLFPSVNGVMQHSVVIPTVMPGTPISINIGHSDSARVMFINLGTGVQQPGPGRTGLKLAAAAPNPFRNSTAISFAVPASGDVELAVFDAAGARVRTLVSGRVAPGSRSVVWTGTNDQGRALENGIYFCRLSGSGPTLTRKLILNR